MCVRNLLLPQPVHLLGVAREAHLLVRGSLLLGALWPVFAGHVRTYLCHLRDIVNCPSGRPFKPAKRGNEIIKQYIKVAVQDSVRDLLPTSSGKG